MEKEDSGLPRVFEARVIHIDNGDISILPTKLSGFKTPIMIEGHDRHNAVLNLDSRLLVRLVKQSPPIAKILKIFAAEKKEQILAIAQSGLQDSSPKAIIKSGPHSDIIYLKNPKNLSFQKDDLLIIELEQGKARKNIRGRGRSTRHAAKIGKIIEVLGPSKNVKTIIYGAARKQNIQTGFSDQVLKETAAMKPASMKGRVDMRKIPFVTIDGEDAKDFDDAVCVEPHKDGFTLRVAIADVAYYIKPGSELDQEAREKGNSSYFPGTVFPMLPERLSNDLCSLRPHEDRPTLVATIHIDKDGNAQNWQFDRAMIHSHARLTYNEVEEVLNGKPHNLKTEIGHLESCYRALDMARHKRGTLEINMPELYFALNDVNEISNISQKKTLTSHKLIEEMMIAANVAAAKTLLDQNKPAIYRNHPDPDPIKMQELAKILKTFQISIPKSGVTQPKQLAPALEKTKNEAAGPVIQMLLLKSLSQAFYGPECQGHFGLALPNYLHFTSPIRRYADLIVHRALLGENDPQSESSLDQTAKHISTMERASIQAERDVKSALIALHYEDCIGLQMAGVIIHVMKSGFFVSIPEKGIEGLVPARLLDGDYFFFDEGKNCLTGRKTKQKFCLGQEVNIELVETDALDGRLIFRIKDQKGYAKSARNPKYRAKNKKKPGRHKNK